MDLLQELWQKVDISRSPRREEMRAKGWKSRKPRLFLNVARLSAEASIRAKVGFVFQLSYEDGAVVFFPEDIETACKEMQYYLPEEDWMGMAAAIKRDGVLAADFEVAPARSAKILKAIRRQYPL